MDPRAQEAARAGISWPSVFAGTFVFLAIEATFGLLAAAIFPTMHGAGTISAGPGIWMIVLSIIALYFGARAATHLSGWMRKLDGLYCGLATFGLSIFASILVASMIAGNLPNAEGTVWAMISANATWLFITLILGGIAAAIGGASGAPEVRRAAAVEQPAAIRPAA